MSGIANLTKLTVAIPVANDYRRWAFPRHLVAVIDASVAGLAADVSLARCLGGLLWSRRLGTEFESLMHTGDQRTLDKLIAGAGIEGRAATATVRDLLDTQQFVPQATLAFRLLRSALLGEPPPDEGADN